MRLSFYSSRAISFGKESHHSVLSAPLQPSFGSLRLLAFPKIKITLEEEKICKYDGHTVHKLSQRRRTADWLAPLESDCSRMHSMASSDWLPNYIKATRPVLEILKMDGYFPDGTRVCVCVCVCIYMCIYIYIYIYDVAAGNACYNSVHKLFLSLSCL
jgi:hypothetical protein